MTEFTFSVRSRQPESRGRFATSHLTDLLIGLMLTLGFFLGPLKLIGVSWFAYSAVDGVALLVLLLVLGGRLAAKRPLIAASGLSRPIVFLAVLCALELANPQAPFIRSVLGLRSWLLYPALYFVGLYRFNSISQLRRLYALLLALGFVTAVYGVFQWKAGPQAFATWSDQYGRYASIMWSMEGGKIFRAFSTFVLPNVFGENMSFLMLLAFAVAASNRAGWRWRVLAWLCFGAMAVGIAASGSREPVVHLLLAATAGILLLGRARERLRLASTVTLLAATAVALVVSWVGPLVAPRFATIFDPQSFFWKWFGPFRGGLSVASAHPFGMGMGYTAGVPQLISNPVLKELPTASFDSGYGAAAAELGYLGLALFTYLALKVGIEGLRSWWQLRPGALKELLVGPALLACTYPVVSVVLPPQAILPGSIYFWVLMGVLIKAPAIQEAAIENQLLRPQVHTRQ